MDRKEALDILRRGLEYADIFPELCKTEYTVIVSREALKKVLETEPKYFIGNLGI